MDWPKTITLAVSIFALAGIVILAWNGINASVESIRTEAAADRAEAAADRRAFQATMDTFRQEMGTFRQEMRALAERQARVEGAVSQITVARQ